jgi:hypothetical protein
LCNTLKNKMANLCLYYSKIIIMPLLTVLLILVVAGVILWLVNTYIPMDRKIKNILNVVVVIAVIIWLLKVFGLLGSLKNLNI